jgi:hypothetical protein
MRQLVGRLFDVPSRIEELHNPQLIEGSAGTLARFFEVAAKPRREEADGSVRAPLKTSLLLECSFGEERQFLVEH